MTTKKIDTFQQQNFRLVFDRLPTMTFMCREFVMPGIQGGNVIQATRFNPVPLPGDSVQYEYLTVNFNLDEDWSNYTEVQKWMNQINFPQSHQQYQELEQEELPPMSDAELLVMNNANLPTKRIGFKDCFPISLSGFPLDSGAQGANPIPITAVFAYSFFQIS